MAVVGSKGGVYPGPSDPAGSEIDLVRWWQAIGQRQQSGADLYQYLVKRAKPAQLQIGIGNTCGLACRHCLLGYGAGSMVRPLTPLPQLTESVTALVEELGTRMICLCDRDALTPHRSIPLFQHLAQLRQHHPNLKFGGITNGLNIPQYADDLEPIHLDYLDISIDGTRNAHDKFRGQGRFDQVLNHLRLALKRNLADRTLVATTLTRQNDDEIVRLIDQLIREEGVQWFDVSPLMAVKLQQYQLHERDMVKFLDSLTQILQPLRATQPTTILIELCAYCAAFLPALVDAGWLLPERIRQDRYGHLYQTIPINDTITLVLRPELIPEYWRHSLWITADGFVVGGCEALTQNDYTRFAVGNIQTESIAAIYPQALKPGSPFHAALLAYDRSTCRNKPCFTHCLGGDPLLANAVRHTYTQNDPNCIWEEYTYVNSAVVPVHSRSTHSGLLLGI